MSTSPPPFPSGTPPLSNSVVVVDDVVEIQQLLNRWLREIGCIVTCVSTGREAARILRTIHIDLVITDVLMPDGDGLDVITELKRAQPTTRIVAMSGGGTHLRAADCLKLARGLGAHGVLTKPFNRQQLLEVIGPYLSAGNATATA